MEPRTASSSASSSSGPSPPTHTRTTCFAPRAKSRSSPVLPCASGLSSSSTRSKANNAERRLRAVIVRMAKAPSGADDLLQETFLRAHRARGSFVKGGRVVPWGDAIARNVYIEPPRPLTHKREKLAAGDDDPAADIATGPEA